MIFYVESVGAIQSRNDQVCDLWWIFWELRRCFGPSLHILISFFLQLKMILKKITHQYHDDIMYPCKKNLEHFWAFRIQHSHFNICTKYCLIEHLSLIFSMVGFFQKLCHFVDLFFKRKLCKSSFISMVVTIKIIPHKWEIMLVTTTSQENKRNAQTTPGLNGLSV